MQNELTKLNASQRKALKDWFPSALASLKVEKHDEGSAVVECVSITGLRGYAFVGPRGKLSNTQKWS